MKNLTFDTGEITLEINGTGRVLSFNPTDVNVYEGFFKLMDEVPERLIEYEKREQEIDRAEMTKEEKMREYVKSRSEIDKVLREIFDGVFGDGSSEAMFGEISTVSLGKNGESIFVNGITALMPFFVSEAEKRNKKIQKIIEESR